VTVGRTARRIVAVVVLAIAIVAVHDARVPVGRQLSTRATVFAIEQYRHFVSPWIGNFVQCRFKPTCSVYGLAAVKKYGALKGGWMAVRRVARCNPWTPLGTVDEP